MNRTQKSSTPAQYERLGRLVVMLLHHQHGYTKQQIFQYLSAYYSSDPKTGEQNRERQFDRDKQALSAQGIDVETVRDEYGADENLYRFRISPKEFKFPQDLHFTPEEMALLELASQTWQGSDMGVLSSSGMHRVKTLDVVAPDPVIGIRPSLNIPLKAFQKIQDAINLGQTVEFTYRKVLVEHAEKRHVEPIIIVQFHGDWLLYAFDLERKDFRNFRLDRILPTGINVTENKTKKRVENEKNAALSQLQNFYDSNIARLKLVPHSLAEQSLVSRANLQENGEYHMSFLDVDSFAAELRYFGPDITVVGPETLRISVKHGLLEAKKKNAAVSSKPISDTSVKPGGQYSE